jgi:hypothetical protein
LLRSWLTGAAFAWSDGGIGAPNLHAGISLPIAFVSALAWFLPPVAVLGALIALCLFFGAAGITACGRALGARHPLALSAGSVLYAAGPFAFNRLVAGHVFILIYMAVLPWIAFAALAIRMESRRMATTAWSGVAAGTTGILFPQAWLLSPLVFAAFAFAARGRPPARVLVRHLVTFVACIVPFAVPIVVLVGGAPAELGISHARIDWEGTQSATLDWLATGGWYIAHYYQSSTSAIAALVGYAVAAAAVVLLAIRREFAILGLFLLAAFIALGFNGPFAPVLATAFTSVPTATALRELADWLLPFELVSAVGIALAGSWRLALPVAACVIVLAWPTLSGTFASFTEPLAQQPPPTIAPGERVLWSPYPQPVGPAGTQAFGTDPTIADVRNPSVAGADSEPLFVTAAFGGERSMAEAARAFGAAAVAMRPDLRSAWSQNQEYALRMRPLPAAPADVEPGGAIVSVSDAAPLVIGLTIGEALRRGLLDSPVVFAEDLPSFVKASDDYRLANPQRGFVPAPIVAYAIPDGMGVAGGSFVTTGGGEIGVPCSTCASLRAAAIGKAATIAVSGASVRRVFTLSPGWHWVATGDLGGGPLRIAARGAVAIAGAAESTRGVSGGSPRRAPLVPARASKVSPSTYVLDDVRAGASVALAQRYDPRWTATGTCGHVILLSWENGWKVCEPQADMTIYFAPQRMLDVFLWIQAAVIAASALWLLTDRLRARRTMRVAPGADRT